MHIEVPPDVARSVEAYRTTGYDLKTSVADLLDNSIGVGQSTRVHMSFEMLGNGELTFYLADNGIGMSKEKLISAMQIGSSKDLVQHELSKYGHGMKTASFAHAKKLVVISRPLGDEENPVGASWDLSHVESTGKWEMEVLETLPRAYLEFLDSLDGPVSGTIVVWENIDRLLMGYKEPTGRFRQQALKKNLDAVSEHIGMVFHRYLDPSFEEARRVEVFINERPVKPWDPFASHLDNYEIPAAGKSLQEPGLRDIEVRAFLLPRHDNWEHAEDYKKTINPANENQGFYLYRANRLIQEPNWLGLQKQEPHSNLARVMVNLNSDWDEFLHVDIRKSAVQFPDAQRDELFRVKNAIVRLADDQRRAGQKTTNGSKEVHKLGEASIGRRKNLIRRVTVAGIDEATGLAVVENPKGQVQGVKVVKPEPDSNVNINVSPEGLQDGLLWTPIVVEPNSGAREASIQLAATHEFYRRVYLPNSISPSSKQALDMIFWALSQAELNSTTQGTRATFEEFRYEISKSLRQLAEELPDYDEDQAGD